MNRDPSATSSILFDGSRLTLARQLAGLRKSELAARLGKSPTAVAAWETGAKRPSGMALKLLTVVEKHGLDVLR